MRKKPYLCTEFYTHTDMKKSFSAWLVILLCAFSCAFTSCTSTKNIPYFQNAERVDFTATKGLYDSRIMPKDALTIYINTTDPAASKPFNLISQSGTSGNTGTLPYLVDNNGNIEFPVLGTVHVAGMTRKECEQMLVGRMKAYLAETEIPIVTVQMSSYHVTVLGEVGGGGVIPVNYEKMNILEALASAGDLTMFGRRDNILLIREDEHGERSMHRINICDANIVNSPYFYVQQNDIIYVEPLKVKARNTFFNQYTSLWMSLVGICMTAAGIIVSVTD